MSPEQARGEEAGPPSDLYALGILFFEMLTGQLPFRSNDRETLLEMQRTRAAAEAARRSSPTCCPRPRRSSLKLLEKERRKRYQDAHHLHEELKALQRSLPSHAVGRRARPESAAPPPPPPPPQSPGVIEWANRAALFSRMVRARVSDGQRAARGADGARAGVGSRVARQRASRARSRATRASSRRSSAAAARSAPRSAARSRSSRTRSRARCARPPPSSKKPRSSASSSQVAERAGATREGAGRSGRAAGRQRRARSARSSSARAPRRRSLEARREQLAEREQKAAREGRAGARSPPPDRRAPRAARALRRGARRRSRAGREKVAARTREGLTFEKAFSEVSTLLLNHLKAKPEARDLLQELMANMHGRRWRRTKAAARGGSESRGPGMRSDCSLRKLRVQERLQLDQRLQVAREGRRLGTPSPTRRPRARTPCAATRRR